MQLDQGAGDGEPEPAALMALGELVLHLLERPPQLGDVVLGDADAGILDGDFHVAARTRQMHVDAAAVAGELHGVGEEIEEHLLQRAAVGLQHQMLRPVAIERDVALGGGLAHHLHAVGDDVGEIHIADIERHAAGLDLRHVEDVVDHLQQIGAARIDIAGIFLIFGMTERSEQSLLHHLGEADHGIERRAQLVTDIGEELRLCPVGGLGAVLLQGIFLGEIDELLLLLLQLAAREPQLGDACPELLLALGEALLALLQHGDVGADADIATVAGPPLVDMQPTAVLDLRLIGAAVVVIGAGDRHALGDDRLGRCGDHLVIRAAGTHRVVGQAVELLIFAVAHDEAVVAVPQHEGFGDRLHGVAKSRIRAEAGVLRISLLDGTDAIVTVRNIAKTDAQLAFFQPVDEALGDWRRDASLEITLLVCTGMLLALLAGGLWYLALARPARRPTASPRS